MKIKTKDGKEIEELRIGQSVWFRGEKFSVEGLLSRTNKLQISGGCMTRTAGIEDISTTPEKKKVLKKFWLFADVVGFATTHFYSEDTMTYWDGKKIAVCRHSCKDTWKKTNCFIEIEVEE